MVADEVHQEDEGRAGRESASAPAEVEGADDCSYAAPRAFIDRKMRGRGRNRAIHFKTLWAGYPGTVFNWQHKGSVNECLHFEELHTKYCESKSVPLTDAEEWFTQGRAEMGDDEICDGSEGGEALRAPKRPKR